MFVRFFVSMGVLVRLPTRWSRPWLYLKVRPGDVAKAGSFAHPFGTMSCPLLRSISSLTAMKYAPVLF